jgi:ubiquitin carboxyl-terminal hydrolase 22/27/51
MVASKTSPGQKDAKASSTSSTAVNEQARSTPKHDPKILPSVRYASEFSTGCPHTKQALAKSITKTLRVYELAVRVSLEQALSSSKTSQPSLHKSSFSSATASKSARSVAGKTLPGTKNYSVSKKNKRNSGSKRTSSPKFFLLCDTCKTFGSTAILCLECSYTGCLTHYKQFHFPSTGHALGVDMVTGCEGLLFCSACNDYVYDETFEKIRLQKIQQMLGMGFIDGVPAGALQTSKIIKPEIGSSSAQETAAGKFAGSKGIIPLFPTSTLLRGFYNMGATCFMSVIFQSLIHNPLIRNFYLSGGHERGVRCGGNPEASAIGLGFQRGESDGRVNGSAREAGNVRATKKGSTIASGYNSTVNGTPTTMNSPSTHCLSCALDDVFAEFFTSSSVAGYGPTKLLTTSWRVKQSLAGYSEQDAHEFLQMVLNELHATHYDSSVLANGASSTLEKIGMPGELPGALRGVEDVNIQDCGCISHRTFCGVLESSITCQVCETVASTVYDPMMDISLEIGAPDKGPLLPNGSSAVSGKTVPGSLNTSSSSNESGASTGRVTPAPVTLSQCLDRFTAGEILDATFNCIACDATRQIQKRLSIKRLPPVLSIQLKRFLHTGSSSKNETRVDFPLVLDMNKYTTNGADKKNANPLLYELFGVVCHQGSLNTGHYTCMMKSNSGRVSIQPFFFF